MLVSLRWLRDYVNVSLPVEELVERLTMTGLEVEGLQKANSALQRVVTARVEAVSAHPHADRLRLCRVSDGSRTYQVVCGAPNAAAGIIVPFALPGAELSSGMTLREVTIRGELSQGMLCSQKELGLGDDASGLWLLAEQTPVGVPLTEALGLEDELLDISITPNRGDCLSLIGIAREVAAICGEPLRYPEINLREEGPPVGELTSVTVDDPVGCPRYAARVVRGITVAPSPAWLRNRLEAVGLRSINNVVDVTNYVLMELGQPLHAFDFDLLAEHRIVVRRAKAGEQFVTLDGVARSLFDDTLLICDGQGPVAVGGIMGGLNSEIRPETRHVLLESAHFQPEGVRRSSKKLGLRTEASYRFERGVDPEGSIRALDRAAELIADLGQGEIAAGRVDVYPQPFVGPRLSLRVERTNRFLGTQLDAGQMAEVLRRIEMQVEQTEEDCLTVTAPSFRPDITREVDLTEEIARLVGYDQVPVTAPTAGVEAAPLDPRMRARLEVKELLAGAGFFEVLNYSFIAEAALSKLQLPPEDRRLQPIAIMNPLSEEQGVMRTTLLAGVLQTAQYNFDRGNDDLRLFELSKVFLRNVSEVLPEECQQLAGVMAGRRHPHLLYGGRDEVDYTDVKGVVEEILRLFYLDGVRYTAQDLPPYLDPACAATANRAGETLAAFGKLHPQVQEAFDLKDPVFVFELDFDKIYALRSSQPLFHALPKYPSVTRDLAIIVEEHLLVQEPLDLILRQQQPLLEDVTIFDIYKDPQLGRGRKSIGYRLVYRALDRNLTDEEVNEIHGRLVAEVLETFQATLR